MITDPLEYVTETLKAQRCFILALQHMGLNPVQMRELVEIYRMNQNLVYVLGAKVPEMEELLRQAAEVQELEKMYNNGKEETTEHRQRRTA